MKKQPSQPADDDILPPENEARDKHAPNQSGSTSRAGAHLRMPPLIEHGAASFVAQAAASVSDLRHKLMRLVKGAAYQLALWSLVGTALVITGYGIYQARHMQLPEFDNFWFSAERALQDDMARTNPADADLSEDMSLDELRQRLDDTLYRASEYRASGASNNALNNDAPLEGDAAKESASNKEPNIETKLSAALLAEQQTALVLKARLDNMEAALLATQERLRDAEADARVARSASDSSTAVLAARFAMADLLLRLEAGLAYDDILEAGDLQPILSRREWALLALHGAVGIPTPASIAVQYKVWLEALSIDLQISEAARPYQRFIGWLAAHANGLVSIRQTPIALNGSGSETQAGDVLADINMALRQGRLDEAVINMGRVLRQIELQTQLNANGAAEISAAHMIALQAVYDDTRAAAELAPMVAQLKRDYISGVRP